MKKTISILRIATLMALGMFGFLFLFGEERDEKIVAFFFHVLFDKVFAFLLLYVAYRLGKKWSKTDELIKRYYKWCEIEEA